jgi:hypothetical protein
MRLWPRHAGIRARRIPAAAATLLAAAGIGRAADFEVVPEEESVTEITVEIESSQGKNAQRSLAIALAASALLPGAGEAYLRENRSAKAFLLAEAGFWAALFMALQARDSYLQSARNQAAEYAGAPAAGKDEDYLNALASYRAYAEKEHRQASYELAQILSGKRDGDYAIGAQDAWDFGSSNTPENTRRWKDFQSTMRHYRGAKVAISFAAGALILNRLGSLAHTLRVYRRTSGKGLSYRFDPELGPEASGLRLTLSF